MPTRVKICGLTDLSDVTMVCAAGADAVGFNMHPASPRFVPLPRLSELLTALPPFVEPVAVCVSRPYLEVRAALATWPRLVTVQMHGDLEEIDGPYIPAFAPQTADDLCRIDAYLQRCRPLAVLVDGYAAGLPGGTGRRAPWELLEGWRPRVPLILAGGLTPENVGQAIRCLRPYAVDVASGVEAQPGRKCADKVRRFVDAVRQADASVSDE